LSIKGFILFVSILISGNATRKRVIATNIKINPFVLR